uniref:Si:ch211-191d15.2 n=1 Tax=Salarias fasciatus TaxID=181472 RepID=A0A672JMW3_SALFA
MLCGVLLVLCVCPLACLMMSPCPPGCCCSGTGVLVLCESLGLRSLPRSVPLSTSALHNLLARFPRGLPPSLESLLLQENRITYITLGALRQLGNLARLDLEENRIRAIQPGALWGLHKLQVLNLKGNQLTSLPLDLPPSLTHLDLSANCISVMDLPSLSPLVNLQVLKINSNCLRSVPESAFDGLPRLRSVDLANNLWVCECDILYLYRWLLSGRLKMATDLVCTEPLHLAHRLLLNLSVMTICPRILKPNDSARHFDGDKPTVQTLHKSRTDSGLALQEVKKENTVGLLTQAQNLPKTQNSHYWLETLTYEECLFLNKTQSISEFHLKTTTSLPEEEQGCRENITARSSNTSEETGVLLSTSREAALPTLSPRTLAVQGSAVIISLLAALCVLMALLTLAVLIVLKRILLRRQRVAPLNEGSSR